MWSNWSEKASASLTQALEKTGDALSKAATTAGKQARTAGGREGGGGAETSQSAAVGEKEVATSAAAAEGGGTSTETADAGGGTGAAKGNNPLLWGSAASSVTASLTQALEKTGDALSKAATNAGKTAQRKADGLRDESRATAASAEFNDEERRRKEQAIIQNFQVGWSNVVESTKAGFAKAETKIREEQMKLNQKLQKAKAEFLSYKRDLKLPLDVPALKDAEVVYLTDRLITMSHPAMPSVQHPDIITGERKMAAVQHLLARRHASRYMIWNLSEVEYDVDIFDQQVLTFSFPGSPSPPLGLLLKILISMESWLKADERNVAVVHCLTGKGRTSCVLAAFLTWTCEAGFRDIHQSLEYIARCKQLSVEELTIPSQRRYTSYFKNMLDGIKPSQPPLMLRRVIISEAPRYAKGPPLSEAQLQKLGESGGSSGSKQDGAGSKDADKQGGASDEQQALRMGCAPYLQIFKAGELLHTAPASLGYAEKEKDPNELPFCQVADGTVSFHVNAMVQGDELIRCRHLTRNRQRVSMFRAALHTGYVPPKVMRLTKSQLDGACADPRFADDFFVDLIFEPVDAEAAGKALLDEESESSTASSPCHHIEGGATYHASAYDRMLHRDSRFWDVIAERKKAHQDGTNDEAKDGDDDKKKNKNKDPNWGPTVGRRRVFDGSTTQACSAAAGTAAKFPPTPDESGEKKSALLETFSIGGELDFLPETIEPEQDALTPKQPPAAKNKKKPGKKKKKTRDTLMEALMGALDEEDIETDTDAELETEEIVFDSEPEVTTTPAPALTPTIAVIPDVTPPAPPSAPAAGDATEQSGAASGSAAEGSGQADVTEPKKEDEAVPTASGSSEAAGAAEAEEKVSTTEDSNAESQEAVHEMEDLLADADLDGVVADDADADGVDDLDLDDAELEDLENFLGAK